MVIKLVNLFPFKLRFWSIFHLWYMAGSAMTWEKQFVIGNSLTKCYIKYAGNTVIKFISVQAKIVILTTLTLV